MQPCTHKVARSSTLFGLVLFFVLFLSQAAMAGDLQHFFTVSKYCQKVGYDHIISSIICQFVDVLDHVMVSVYTGIRAAFMAPIRAMLTLYIAVFGAQVLMGTAQLHARDILGRLVKIALVWMFATDVQYGVGVAFTFYVGIMAEGGQIILNTIFTGQQNEICGLDYSKYLINGNSAPSDAMPLFGFFDDLISCTFKSSNGLNVTKVMGFFLAVGFLYPPLMMIFSWWVQTTVFAVARTVLGFLTALAAITFLISLAPIFLSFMLFQVTNHYFENWLRFLTAYSVQVVLVFGIVAFWILLMLQMVYFFIDISDMIFAYGAGDYYAGYMSKTSTWAICDADYPPDIYKTIFVIDPYTGSHPHPTCKHYPPAFGEMIVPSKIMSSGELLHYLFFHLIALLVLSYAFTILLEKAHEIAASIAGPAPVPQFLGGIGKNNFGQAVGMKKSPGLKPPPPKPA